MRDDLTINVRRYYYGPKETVSKHLDEHGEVWTGTVAEARQEIAEMESVRYYTAHNEAARPTYRICYA